MGAILASNIVKCKKGCGRVLYCSQSCATRDRPVHAAECNCVPNQHSKSLSSSTAADVGLEYAGHLLVTREDVHNCLKDIKMHQTYNQTESALEGSPGYVPSMCIGCQKRPSFVDIDVSYDLFLVQRSLQKRGNNNLVRMKTVKMAPSERRAALCVFCYALHIAAVEFGKNEDEEDDEEDEDVDGVDGDDNACPIDLTKRARYDTQPASASSRKGGDFASQIAGYLESHVFDDVCATVKKLWTKRFGAWKPNVFEFVDVVAEARQRAALLALRRRGADTMMACEEKN